MRLCSCPGSGSPELQHCAQVGRQFLSGHLQSARRLLHLHGSLQENISTLQESTSFLFLGPTGRTVKILSSLFSKNEHAAMSPH